MSKIIEIESVQDGYDVIHEVARQMYDKFGMVNERVRFEWITRMDGNHTLVKSDVESYRLAR